ncbi:unnamed protein product, partial [Symbiodinium pilosum]
SVVRISNKPDRAVEIAASIDSVLEGKLALASLRWLASARYVHTLDVCDVKAFEQLKARELMVKLEGGCNSVFTDGTCEPEGDAVKFRCSEGGILYHVDEKGQISTRAFGA